MTEEGEELMLRQEPFFLRLYARLISLLAYHEGLRLSLTNSARELSHGELYPGTNRQGFWETNVAPAFMTSTRVRFVDSDGIIDVVDGRELPSVPRSCSELRIYLLTLKLNSYSHILSGVGRVKTARSTLMNIV